jgi:hypothetical protein
MIKVYYMHVWKYHSNPTHIVQLIVVIQMWEKKEMELLAVEEDAEGQKSRRLKARTNNC